MKQVIALLAALLTGSMAYAQPAQYILALSKGDKKMVVLNYETLDSITAVDISEDPHEIVTNETGTIAYISHPVLTGKGHTISIVDLKKMVHRKSLDTRPFYTPHGLSYVDGQLWFTAQGSKAVAIYDTREDQVTEALGTGQDFTHLIYVKPDGKTFYTTNVESGTVSIYEKKEIPPYMPPTGVLPPNAKPRTEWRQTLVNAGFGAEGFDVSEEANELWAARPDGHIIVVDLTTRKIKAEINTHVLGLHRLKITPDGKSVAIVSVKTGDLLFYNRSTRQQETRKNIGQGAGIYMDALHNRMFVSCTPNNYISVIDLRTRNEIKKITINRPDAVTSVLVKQDQ
jgi:DNA-binding beta-propeller fold protein YncE